MALKKWCSIKADIVFLLIIDTRHPFTFKYFFSFFKLHYQFFLANLVHFFRLNRRVSLSQTVDFTKGYRGKKEL